VPHHLIETTPVWGRKNKSNRQNSSASVAWSLFICKFHGLIYGYGIFFCNRFLCITSK
jgi:uncharacterized membrane protein YpjA